MGGSSAPGGASFQYGVNLNGGIRLVSMRWYHVAFTIEQAANATNPRAIRIFLDGNLIAGRDWSASPEYQRQQLQNTDPIELGRYRNPNIQLFNGWMDEIRFWDIARSAEDIKDGRFTVYAGNAPSLLQDPLGHVALTQSSSGTGDTPHLLAYYRANEGTGFVVTPVPYGPQDPNQMEGQLNQGTYWDVSGVQGLPQSVSLAQSTVSLIELYGSDTLYRPITFWVASLPSRGKLYRAVNLQTAGTQITSSNTSLTGWYLFYESTGPIEAGYDNFTFYVTDDSNMSSTPATVEISLTAVVGCDGQLGSGLVYDSCEVCGGNNTCVGCDGVPGSGKTIDACGVCGGMNQTCFCLDGEGSSLPSTLRFVVVVVFRCSKLTLRLVFFPGQYRGFNQSELDKVLLLYEIEQAIASLEEVDAHLSSLFNQLVSSDPQSLSLGGDIDELRNWSAQCFGDFCGNLQSMFDQMSIDANETITPPVCGFSN